MKELDFNVELTYKEICKNFGWSDEGGNTRKKNVAELERCYKFYHPINPKTKKEKKSYVFTAKIDDIDMSDKRVNNGGARDNAGRTNAIDYRAISFLLTHIICYQKKNNKMEEVYKDGKLYVYFINFDMQAKLGWTVNQNKVIYQEWEKMPEYKTCTWSDKKRDYDDIADWLSEIVRQKVYANTTKQLTRFGNVGKVCRYIDATDKKVKYSVEMYKLYGEYRDRYLRDKGYSIRQLIKSGKWNDMTDGFCVEMENKWSTQFGKPTQIKVANYLEIEIDEQRYNNFCKFAKTSDARGMMYDNDFYKNIKYEYTNIGNWCRCKIKDKTYDDIYNYIENQFEKQKISEEVYKNLKELARRLCLETSNKMKDENGQELCVTAQDYKYNGHIINLDNIEQSKNVIQSNKEDFEWKEFNILGLEEKEYKKKCKKSKEQIKEELKEIEENNQSKKEDSEVKYTKVYKKREERKTRETKAKEIKRRKAIENMDDGSLDLPF